MGLLASLGGRMLSRGSQLCNSCCGSGSGSGSGTFPYCGCANPPFTLEATISGGAYIGDCCVEADPHGQYIDGTLSGTSIILNWAGYHGIAGWVGTGTGGQTMHIASAVGCHSTELCTSSALQIGIGDLGNCVLGAGVLLIGCDGPRLEPPWIDAGLDWSSTVNRQITSCDDFDGLVFTITHGPHVSDCPSNFTITITVP